MSRSIFISTALSVALLLMAQPVSSQSPDVTRADYEAVIANSNNPAIVSAFLAKLPTIEIDQDGAKRKFYIVEGDLLRTEEEVITSIKFQASGDRAIKPTGELKVMLYNGKPDFWAKGARTLTYAVNRKTFQSDADYKAVVSEMKAAASVWENVCPQCGVSFVHRAELDANPKIGEVTFIVSYVGAQRFIASAFFPHYTADRRQVLIAKSYFEPGLGFDRVGVLRHELGHVLGYRHEHIEGIIGCATEGDSWKPLTPYDPKSVMHYFCGGAGSLKLELTDDDKSGHIGLYK